MTLYDILHSTIFYIPQRGVHGLARSSLPILYYTILYYTILYYTILYCTVRPVHLLRVFTSLENGRTGSRGPPARDRRARAPPAGRMWRAVFITVSSLYVCMFVCMYIHIYTHTYISLSLSLYIYIYIYITYMHSQFQLAASRIEGLRSHIQIHRIMCWTIVNPSLLLEEHVCMQ